MFYPAKTITLKNGQTATLRVPDPARDAAPLAQYLKDVAGESPFVLAYPEERNFTPEKEEAFLRAVLDSPNDLMLVCEVDGRIAGNCHLNFFGMKKVAHRASVAIALYKEFWGLGIGTALFEQMIAAARERGIMQLELEYIDGNDRGRALYEKMGFRHIGSHPNAIRQQDGSLVDLCMMIKEL
ncbi:MAG: GNAT family N-acetyltransferase [Clostridia bacterium]|nr:GNAT family N-acetyltransferase [Clostridia bacterium]